VATGATAVPEPQAPPETPAAQPAPEGGGGAAPAGQPGAEGGSTQPAGQAPEGGETGRAPGEDPGAHVPWPKWRQLNREYTTARREWDGQRQRYEQQVAEARQQAEARARFERDYKTLEAALRAHPDLAQALAERLGEPGTARPGQAPMAALPPEVLQRLQKLDKLDELTARFEQADKLRHEAQERAADEQLSNDLNGTIGKLLQARKDGQGHPLYGEEFTPMVRAYVLQRVNSPEMEGATLEDVPYLVAEWFKHFEGAIQKRINGLRAGVQGDQKLPPAPGSTVPVSQKTPVGALDEQTAQVLERELAQRLGWHNNGDQNAAGGGG